MKWVKRLVVAAIVLVVLAVLGVWLFANYATKKGIEVGGKFALGVDTKVDSVNIGFLSSSISLSGFQIANPEGYQSDRLMALGHGKVACDIGSLLGDEIIVREILLDSPELTIDLKPGLPPKSNLGDLMARIKRDESSSKFRVDLIRITQPKVRFHMLAGKTADLVLPDIEMKEVKNSDGTPLMLADIFRQVLASMGDSAFKNSKGVVPDDLLKGFGGTLGAARGVLDQVGKGVGGIGKEVGGALDGLLGKDKKRK